MNEEEERVLPSSSISSLGEYFSDNTVKNTEENIKKFQEVLEYAERRNWKITKRIFAGIMGHACFLSHTIYSPLFSHHSAMRAYSTMCAETKEWDVVYEVFPPLQNSIRKMAEKIVQNEPVDIKPLVTPSTKNTDYTFVICFDASAKGLGTFVEVHHEKISQKIFCFNKAWESDGAWRHASAASEPRALTTILKFLQKHFPFITHPRIAVITDHIALPTAQRKWYSFCGGFSTSYELNRAYETLYMWDQHAQIFYVEGTKNFADGPSRSSDMNLFVTERPIPLGFVFPSLTSFYHPYLARERKSYAV